MKIQNFKRINKEDFDKQYQSIIEKIGFSINAFADDVQNAFNKNLSIDDNLNQSKVQITASVNSSGTPLSTLQFKTGLNKNSFGVQVVKAANITNPTTNPIGYPFITYTENSGIITINNISNLQSNQQYKLSLIIIG